MVIFPTVFLRSNESASSCKDSATKWSQVPCCHSITWKAKAVKIRSISFLIHSCSTSYVSLSVSIVTPHCLSTHTQKSQ